MPAMRRTGLSLMLLTIFACLAGGCIERTVTITSEPSGALVHLNDQAVGRTPVTVPFTFYGVYSVRLERDGSKPLWTTAKASAPWWDYPGPDLVAEMLPHLHSRVQWNFVLEPAPEPSKANADILLDHAYQLRATVEQGEHVSHR